MSKRTEVRRRDRRMDDAWIRRFLTEAPYGFLALSSDDAPHLNSNLFVYVEEDHAIYMHTARTGRTPEILDDPLPATFSAGSVGRLLPADEALEFSVEYGSVVVYGRAVNLTDPEAKRTALQRLLDRYAPHLRPGRDYRPITDDELGRTAVYRIDVEEWTGKEKAAPADFPGAFPITDPPIPLREDPTGSSASGGGDRAKSARYTPYAPRPVEYHGVLERAGHRLKRYSVRYGSDPLDLDRYQEGVELALSDLPEAAPEAGRPGLGFVIVHRGRDVDYVVQAWWDRENELPVRVYVRDDGPWRPARTGESFCVWDLEIISHERNAYVETVLTRQANGPEAYLGRIFAAGVGGRNPGGRRTE